MMTLAEAHALLPSARLIGEPAVAVERVHSDTRTLQRGDLFVALPTRRASGSSRAASPSVAIDAGRAPPAGAFAPERAASAAAAWRASENGNLAPAIS